MPTIYAILIIEKIGDYPWPVDPDNPTQEEQDAINAWQARYDNYWGLCAKADKIEWDISEECEDVIQPGAGPTLSKAGQYGILHHFPVMRIQKPSATSTESERAAWYANKVSALIGQGWALKGWTVEVQDNESAYQVTRAFLEARSYVFE